MGYENPNTTSETKSDEIRRNNKVCTIPKTESDEVIKSSVKNLVRIPSESEVTSDNENSDEIIKSGVEELVPILNENEVTLEDKKKEEVDLEDIFQIQDVVLREKLLTVNRLIANIKSLNDNPTPDCVLNSSVSIPTFEESNNSLSDNLSPEFETFCDHTKETRSGNTTTHADDSLPE
nr:hypothetical protein [Tanacetum cinerariifolium]